MVQRLDYRLPRRDAARRAVMSLTLRYDVFGAEALGNARLEGKYEFPVTPGVRIDALPDRVVPFDRIGSDLNHTQLWVLSK